MAISKDNSWFRSLLDLMLERIRAKDNEVKEACPAEFVRANLPVLKMAQFIGVAPVLAQPPTIDVAAHMEWAGDVLAGKLDTPMPITYASWLLWVEYLGKPSSGTPPTDEEMEQIVVGVYNLLTGPMSPLKELP